MSVMSFLIIFGMGLIIIFRYLEIAFHVSHDRSGDMIPGIRSPGPSTLSSSLPSCWRRRSWLLIPAPMSSTR